MDTLHSFDQQFLVLAGTQRQRSNTNWFSLEWKVRLLAAMRVGVGVALGGLIVIWWPLWLDKEFIPFTPFPLILILMAAGGYHLPGVVMTSVEFLGGITICSLGVVVTYFLISPTYSYWSTLIVWAFTFLLTLADKTGKHILLVKFAVLFYVAGALFNPVDISTVAQLGQFVFYMMVISLLLPVAIIYFVIVFFAPTFASDLIFPEILEAIQDCRDVYSAVVRVSILRSKGRRGPVTESEAIEQQEAARIRVAQVEARLSYRIELIKKYIRDSQIESWNTAKIHQCTVLFADIEKLYRFIVGNRIAVQSDNPDVVPCDYMPSLARVHVEVLTYFDHLINALAVQHKLKHLVQNIQVVWPTADGMEAGKVAVHEELKQRSKQDFEATNEIPFTPKEITRFAALLGTIQGVTGSMQTILQKARDIEPNTTWKPYKIAPLALVRILYFGLVTLFHEFEYGVFKEMKKSRYSVTHAIRAMTHSRKWRFPARYATVVASTFAISIWVASFGDELFITHGNRMWFAITAILIILPTQGATMSRGVHRFVGTLIGCCFSYLYAWAVLSSGGPESPARWIVMEILLFLFLFAGGIVQQIPGTGYAAALTNLTIQLIAVPYFHSDVSHFPVSVLVTRIIFIAIAVLWSVTIFCLLQPVKSAHNLEMSLLNSLCTAGKTFTSILECGILQDSEEGTCIINESTRKEIAHALSAIHTASTTHKVLMVDAYWETFLNKNYGIYEVANEQVQGVLQRLIIAFAVFDNGFDIEITQQVIQQMRPAIQYVLRPIAARVAKVTELRASFVHAKKNRNAKKDIKRLASISRRRENNTSSAKAPVPTTNTEDNVGNIDAIINFQKMEPQSFEELLEDLKEVRKHLFRTNLYVQTNSRIGVLRFFAFLYALGQFVTAWEELRRTILRVDLKERYAQLGIEALSIPDEEFLHEMIIETGDDEIGVAVADFITPASAHPSAADVLAGNILLDDPTLSHKDEYEDNDIDLPEARTESVF